MNEQLIKNIEWLDKTLVEFDHAVEEYGKDFNSRIQPSMIINLIQQGKYTIEYLNIHVIVALEDVLEKAEIKNDSIKNKVYKYIDNEILKFTNNLKNKCR
ncbi:hypothetical protein CNEO4_620036 [Clostridium neonatale]|uniref:hypothetical protein n=1 Tax=Clostridium neonatale TaxID=137838 RepID=UPI00291B904B|nr:hypothetical protein [Clostridium neonatale]CAI3674257.1 hypothetical protein CNEO4_620036 [Clostridium neonatale]